MHRTLQRAAAAVVLLAALSISQTGWGQKRGGVLNMYDFDSPPSVSMLEEATASS